MDEDIHKRICEILLEEKGLTMDETKITDEEFEDKLKNYIGRKLDEDADPNAMKGLVGEYLALKGE